MKTTVNLRFPGQFYDKESGFHYNHHRYYDPQTGRYLSSDLIGLVGGVNLYGYVLNNPLKYTDPLGLDPWSGDNRDRPTDRPDRDRPGSNDNGGGRPPEPSGSSEASGATGEACPECQECLKKATQQCAYFWGGGTAFICGATAKGLGAAIGCVAGGTGMFLLCQNIQQSDCKNVCGK